MNYACTFLESLYVQSLDVQAIIVEYVLYVGSDLIFSLELVLCIFLLLFSYDTIDVYQ